MTRYERDRMRMAILEEADIVCTTLAFSGSGLFLRLTRKFDVVVIDEAAQVGTRTVGVRTGFAYFEVCVWIRCAVVL